MQDSNKYLETCQIKETVWRSKRTNIDNDELVVAKGTENGIKGHFMAWEVKQDRTECISWNGTVSWYPRMFWAEVEHKNTIAIMDFPEFLTEREPGQKFYNHDIGKTVIEDQGNYYLKLKPFLKEGKKTIYVPAVATQKPNSLSAAISYVQWFNENHRQITKYGSLLSQTKKAKKRRKERLAQQIYKKIG